MWLNIPLLALFLLTTLPPCISFILPKSSVPFSSILNLDSSSSASSSQSSSSSIPPVQVPSPATSTYNATATANTNNDDNIPSPSWSRFESSEKYKRRCLILEDALANATASARKQRNRATLLEAVVRNGGGGEKGGAGADVAGGESDPREDRLRSDALMSLERRAAFLAERVSDLSREQALAKEDLKAAEEMVLRAGKGEEEAKRRLRMEGGRREEAEKDLRDLEAFLFEVRNGPATNVTTPAQNIRPAALYSPPRASFFQLAPRQLEGEHAKERKAWARREEEVRKGQTQNSPYA